MRLNTEELCEFLAMKLGSEVAEETVNTVRSNRISARSFLDLKEDDLKELTPLMGDRKALFRLIKLYSSIVSLSAFSVSEQAVAMSSSYTYFCTLVTLHFFLHSRPVM